MKLTPASIAVRMTATESSWSGFPQLPNIIVPRQSGLTLRPVRPSVRYFIAILRSGASARIMAEPAELRQAPGRGEPGGRGPTDAALTPRPGWAGSRRGGRVDRLH